MLCLVCLGSLLVGDACIIQDRAALKSKLGSADAVFAANCGSFDSSPACSLSGME